MQWTMLQWTPSIEAPDGPPSLPWLLDNARTCSHMMIPFLGRPIRGEELSSTVVGHFYEGSYKSASPRLQIRSLSTQLQLDKLKFASTAIPREHGSLVRNNAGNHERISIASI